MLLLLFLFSYNFAYWMFLVFFPLFIKMLCPHEHCCQSGEWEPSLRKQLGGGGMEVAEYERILCPS